MAGLLDLFGQRDPNDPVNMGLLGMSAALGTPVRQGGGVGPAFGAFGQGYQGSQQAEMRRLYMKAQIKDLEAQAAERTMPKQRNPMSVTGGYIDADGKFVRTQQDKEDKDPPEVALAKLAFPDDPAKQREAIALILKRKGEHPPQQNNFTLATVADPTNPNAPPRILPVSTKTGQPGSPIGTAPPSAASQKDLANATNETEKIEMLGKQIETAEGLLNNATGSGVGKVRDVVTQFIGMDTDKDNASSQLETIGAWMMANVPRFRGQDSNRDVALYQQMAANVGDRGKTIQSRKAALQTLKQLRSKAGSQEQASPSSNSAQDAAKAELARRRAAGGR